MAASDVEAPDAVNPGVPRVVLVVEDDTAVREAVDRGLTLHGFSVRSVGDAEQAQRTIARDVPAVMVVDVGLPGMSGIDLCTSLRANEIDVPILILSARDAVGDRVAGLSAGADDYLVKPFALDELVARLHALLRRAARPTGAAGGRSVAGPLWIDLDRRRATANSNTLELSRREFDLLSTFVANPGIVLSRIRLLELVWGYDFDVDTNVVDVFVGYLRRKLALAGLPKVIETVRGVGFVLRVP
ncbi:MAG TPA: response regulator transcription factor [Ilumatobacteraceae bacterium]|nr:response regulator transcription factor [Ilumatobacteraceae bacterium]